jgi:Na+/proline symporter
MSAHLLLIFVAIYFLILFAVARYTSRNSNNESFFIGNRNSNWMLVAFGMIGTSLSGVTFVSVPGGVGNITSVGGAPPALGYFQVVIGYLLGYIVIAYVLLPLYYRLNLTSIYNYLHGRFGEWAYKTGASFFILSRTVGATARLYLVINILHLFILSQFNIPFWVSVAIVLIMILLYTYKGGVKTIVYTDTLQTTLMILGMIVCIIYILSNLHLSVGDAVDAMQSRGLTKIFNTDINSKGFFLKQIIGGAFITIAMTGLDQEMMQKNISVRTLKDSQKNILAFSIVLLVVNLMFLLLGGLLYLYAYNQGTVFIHAPVAGHPDAVSFFHSGVNIAGNKNIAGDNLFPSIALGLLQPMPGFISIIFVIALISALFPSADGALTALTSSFCIDILNIRERKNLDEKQIKKIRWTVHITFAFIFFLSILIFRAIDSRSIIDKILELAGYTYGPLLGLFAFGILTKRSLPDKWIIALIAVLSPLLCYLLQINSAFCFGKYSIGIEILLINGSLTFLGLLLISKRGNI